MNWTPARGFPEEQRKEVGLIMLHLISSRNFKTFANDIVEDGKEFKGDRLISCQMKFNQEKEEPLRLSF